MKIPTLKAVAKALLPILIATLALSSLATPCLAQPAVAFSQIMIPVALDRCIPHMTAAYGEFGYAIDQTGDRWVTATKGGNRAVMVCGISQGRSTQLTIFVAGPDSSNDSDRLQAVMQRRFHH
jgi:hypothetical protein